MSMHFLAKSFVRKTLFSGGFMNKFCIITNREKDIKLKVSRYIADILNKNSCRVAITEESEECDHYTDVSSILDDTECAIVVGGDGTIINAAHDLLNSNIPILGVNLGTLGFLAEIELQNIEDAIHCLIHDKYMIEDRMMIEAVYTRKDSKESKPEQYRALNDIVIARSGFSRIICVGIYVNGSWVKDYRGDGVIISTPTGSTGYNLSAGGPIVAPKGEMMIITPICPHTFNSRSIVVSSDDVIEVRIRESKKTQEEEAIVTVDGDMALKLSANDKVVIQKSKQKTNLIRLEGQSFFDLLRTKLGEA